MKILNIHSRKINKPIHALVDIVDNLGTDSDKFWPSGKWPEMWLEQGMTQGGKGGHGPIRYIIDAYEPGKSVTFKFTAPSGFNGFHRLQLNALNDQATDVVHTIDMKTNILGALKWGIAIRWLHDALLEDAFDNIENHHHQSAIRTEWNWWVKTIRSVLK